MLQLRDTIWALFPLSPKGGIITHTEVNVEGPIMKIRLTIDEKTFIHVFSNNTTKTLAYTSIRESKRIYGIDRDNIRGWHEHPFEDPATHIKCDKVTFKHFLVNVKELLE